MILSQRILQCNLVVILCGKILVRRSEDHLLSFLFFSPLYLVSPSDGLPIFPHRLLFDHDAPPPWRVLLLPFSPLRSVFRRLDVATRTWRVRQAVSASSREYTCSWLGHDKIISRIRWVLWLSSNFPKHAHSCIFLALADNRRRIALLRRQFAKNDLRKNVRL